MGRPGRNGRAAALGTRTHHGAHLDATTSHHATSPHLTPRLKRPKTRPRRPKTPPRPPKRPPRPPQEAPRRPPAPPKTGPNGLRKRLRAVSAGKPKSDDSFIFLIHFGPPGGCQIGSKSGPEHAWPRHFILHHVVRGPRRVQEAPRRPQDPPRGPQEPPKTPPEAAKDPPGGPQDPPNRSPESALKILTPPQDR